MFSNNVLNLIGYTPIVQLCRLFSTAPFHVFAKLEMLNPGGSIKDRPARLMLEQALLSGAAQPGDTIIESSSGNMAIGLAQACRYHGLNLVVVVDPKVNRQTVKLLKTYGARIEYVQKPDGPNNYLGARLKRVAALLDEIPGSIWLNQYANRSNPMAHQQTMHEILESMPQPPDYLFVAASTCGTLMGCMQYLKARQLDTKIVAVDALGSVLFGAPSGERHIPGYGAGRPSQLLDPDLIDIHIQVCDRDCVSGCRQLLNQEAILAGGSSGAIVSAIQHLGPYLPADSHCAAIFCDRGERYLDTIFSDEWVRNLPQHQAPRITTLPSPERETVLAYA